MTTACCDTFSTRFGPFSVAVNDAGSVVATAFGDLTALRGRLGVCHVIRDKLRTAAARRQIVEFLAGRRAGFDLSLAPGGTPFQQRVWRALRRIPFAETRTYGQLARQLRSSPRAVGRANATNPICLLVPCHRVVGAGGALTGFAFGLTTKRRLLALERRCRASAG
jgi:methylated-DNA-[protein]-cysteine S-methyltransferase